MLRHALLRFIEFSICTYGNVRQETHLRMYAYIRHNMRVEHYVLGMGSSASIFYGCNRNSTQLDDKYARGKFTF